MGNNLLNTPILAFFLGILAVILRSDLEIPRSVGKFIALYLLFSIGYLGGAALSKSVWSIQTVLTLSIGLGMSIWIPTYVFFLGKKFFPVADAAAIAASYGSISVVTFITATSFLSDAKIYYGGHMVALMALMECPAIIVGMVLYKKYGSVVRRFTYLGMVKELFRNGSILVLLGSLGMGFVSKPKEFQHLEPFVVGIQKGMLVFFLLEMGLLVGKNLSSLKKLGKKMMVLGLLVPMFNAFLGLMLVSWCNIALGDSLLLVVLLSSASYIAVPAAFRMAVPEADPSIYLSMALAITFPFNLIVGIPIYYWLLLYLQQL